MVSLTKVLQDIMLQSRSVKHRSRIKFPGLEPGPFGGKQAASRLNYGTTNCTLYSATWMLSHTSNSTCLTDFDFSKSKVFVFPVENS
jgi:hypothetical protein